MEEILTQNFRLLIPIFGKIVIALVLDQFDKLRLLKSRIRLPFGVPAHHAILTHFKELKACRTDIATPRKSIHCREISILS